MGMRKYMRAVAHYRMNELGYTQINRPRTDVEHKPVPSGFAQTWRKIMTPGTPHHKEWMKHWKWMKSRPMKGEA